jgi:hypothetical protein
MVTPSVYLIGLISGVFPTVLCVHLALSLTNKSPEIHFGSKKHCETAKQLRYLQLLTSTRCYLSISHTICLITLKAKILLVHNLKSVFLPQSHTSASIW